MSFKLSRTLILFIIILLIPACNGGITEEEAGQSIDLVLKDVGVDQLGVKTNTKYQFAVSDDYLVGCKQSVKNLDEQSLEIVSNLKKTVENYTHTKKLYTGFCPIQNYSIIMRKNTLLKFRDYIITLQQRILILENRLNSK